MRAMKIRCLHCSGPTCRDPGYDGVKSEAPYCPACDAVWQKAACVVCGEVFLVDVTRHRGGHHCDPGTESRIEAGRKREAVVAQAHAVAPKPEGQRLIRGFRLWHADER
jgi:hypothetical protein